MTMVFLRNDLKYTHALLGEALRRAREHQGISVRELARSAGIGHSQILRVESGAYDCMVDSYVRICGALGLRFSDLLERCISPNGDQYWLAVGEELKKPLLTGFQTDKKSLKSLHNVAFGGCVAVAWLLRVVSPKKTADALHYPADNLRHCFTSWASNLEREPLPMKQRFALLHQLQTGPVAAMIALFNFPTPDMVKEQVSRDASHKYNIAGSWWPFELSARIDEWDDRELRLLAWHRKQKLTETETLPSVAEVKSQLPSLLERLKKATAKKGKKSELAEFLQRVTKENVPLASVSRWLSGEREPGGEVALQMDVWATAQGYPRAK